MTIPGSEPAGREASVDPVRDPTDLVATPDLHQPGQPPGGQGPTGPNFVYTSRGGPQVVADVPAEVEGPTGPEFVEHDPATDPPQASLDEPAGEGGQNGGPDEGVAAPPKNASRDTWVDFAVEYRGADRDAIADMGRDQLVEAYGS